MRQLACMLRLSLLLWCSAGIFAQPRYVDAHIHWDTRANFVEDLVRIYRKNNAVACLSAQREHFDALKAAAKKYPDTIIPIYWIDLDDSDVIEQIDRAHTAGPDATALANVGLHKPRQITAPAPAYCRSVRCAASR